MADHAAITQVFQKMDSDSILERVDTGFYIDGRNFKIYTGRDGNAGAVRFIDGTVELFWAPQAGVNTGIGAYADETGDTLIAFIHNDQGSHSIIRYFPGDTDAHTITIPQLNLQVNKPIVGCAFINQELLIFTDGGDYPKCINLPRADDTDKKSIVRMYLPPSREIPTLDSRVLAVQLTLDGVPQGFAIPLAPANNQQLWDFQPQFSHFAGEFNGNTTLAAAFTARSCAEFLEFEATQAGMWSLTGIVTDTINGVPQPSVNAIVEYWNRYNNPFTDEQIRLARVAPNRLTPTAIVGYDESRKSSQIDNRVFQFQYAFRLKDKEKSVTSHISDIALPLTSLCQNASSDYNCIDIGFDDPWLSDPSMRGEIEFIDLFVRERNSGSWFKFKTMEKWEWVYSRSYRFFNDGTYTASDQAYNEAGNTYVPPIANTLEALVDADDNTRIVFGGIKEGDPNPCVEINTQVIFDGNTSVSRGGVKVTGKIYINSVFDPTVIGPRVYNANQPIGVYDNQVGPVYGGMGPATHTSDPSLWKQKIPLGGFFAFMAGTDLTAISIQNVPSVSVSGGLNSPTLWAAPNGSQATGRNVYDLTFAGGGGIPANEQGRAAARNAIKAVEVYSTFEIDGCIPGETYVLRFASNLCESLGGAGGIYDIDAVDRGYQRTSARTAVVGSVTAANIAPGRNECTITIPLTATGPIDIGYVVIMDTTDMGAPITQSFCVDGYLYDYEGNDNGYQGRDIRNFGIPAEKQTIRFANYDNVANTYVNFPNPVPFSSWLAFAGLPLLYPYVALAAYLDALDRGNVGADVVYTDHNGYFFFFQRGQLLKHPRAQVLGVTGDPLNPQGILTVPAGPAAPGQLHYQLMNDWLASKWEGDLNTSIPLVAAGPDLVNNGGETYVFANLNASTSLKTHIKTTITTLGGAPVSGITAILEDGRVVQSRSDGVVDIIAYGDTIVNNNDRITDRLILQGSGACSVDFVGGEVIPASVTKITQFWAGNPYSDTPEANWKTIPNVFAVFAGIGTGRDWMRGAVHPFGYYLQRDNGDRTPVKWVTDVRIPILTEDLNLWDPLSFPTPGTYSAGMAKLTWSIAGAVPGAWIGEWTSIQLVSADDMTRLWSLQWLASSVTYSSIWDETLDEPTAVNYSTGNPSEIYISISDSLTRYQELHRGALVNQIQPNIGYLWEAGDMLRILTDNGLNPLNGNVIDVPITGQRGQWIIIENDSAIPEMFGGEMIEIYRPRKPTESSVFTFYDLPNGLIPITNGTWSSTSGTLDFGAGWVLPTLVPIRLSKTTPWKTVRLIRESIWISDFYSSTDWGKGKPWFQDPDAATQDRGVLMRYTDSYKPGTNINGLNFVNGINFRIVENWLGPIRKMERIGDVIFVVCENGAFSVYVAIEQLQTTPDAVVQTAGGILGTIRPFAHKHGTKHPMSVVRGTTNVLYYDVANGAIVQYNSNALQDVAEQNKMHAYFSEKALTIPSGKDVCAGWDNVNGQFTFTFAAHTYDDGFNVQDIEAESITYFDKANAFVAKLDVATDFWGKTRSFIYSFKDGRLWGHGFPAAVKNNVQGVDLKLSIDIPFIGSELVLKTPQYIWVSRGPANKKAWSAPLVRTDDGQVSMIPKEDFDTQRGGISRGNFFADRNTPSYNVTDPTLSNGDPLMGTAFVVRLEYDGDEEPALINATLFYSNVTPT